MWTFDIVSNEPEGRRDAWLVLDGSRVVGEFAWYSEAQLFALEQFARKKGLQK